MQTVTPQQHNLYDCLNGKKYLIDFYQRHYVWDKETVTILLKDIFFVFNSCYEQHKQNDLTQETLSNFNWYYLNTYITNNVDGNVFIVDGQQRLTTVSLILVSLFHITDNENHKNVLKNCIAGVDAFSGNIYLIDNDKRKDVMESVFMNREFKKDNQSVTEANIYARYQDIYKYLKGELRDDKKRIEAFTLYVLYRLILVQLNIPQQDTPMIFEVINDRGVGLRPFEILKGKLLGKLSKTETDSYSDLWDQALLFVKEKEDSFFDDYFKSQYITKKNSKVEAEIRNEYHRYIFLDNSIGNDLKFRFNMPGKKELWEKNMLYLKENYPELNTHVETILTQYFIDAVLNKEFSISEFCKKFRTRIDYIEPASGMYYNNKIECEKACPGFFPTKNSFMKFLKVAGLQNKEIDLTCLISYQIRASRIYHLDSGQYVCYEDRRKPGFRVKCLDETKKYELGFIDCEDSMEDIATEFCKLVNEDV